MRALLAVGSALFVTGCTCAQLDPGLQFPCDAGSQCADDERCVGGWCVADAGSAGGGAPGGGGAGGSGGLGGAGGIGGSGGPSGVPYMLRDCTL